LSRIMDEQDDARLLKDVIAERAARAKAKREEG
jgi:hypothetical protein